MRTDAVIVAAGIGVRMNTDQPKQFLMLSDRPILAYTLAAFETSPVISEIVLVVSEDKIEYVQKEIIGKYNFLKVKKIVPGGEKRQDSVFNGLSNLSDGCDMVVIHDGIRPFVSHALIKSSVEEACKTGSCVVGVPVRDTTKIVGSDNIIEDTVERDKLWTVQTPQVFSYEIIIAAYEKAEKDKFYGTDDAQLVERMGESIRIISGSYDNIKITVPEDIILAERILFTKKEGR